jgi:hypothetical protein
MDCLIGGNFLSTRVKFRDTSSAAMGSLRDERDTRAECRPSFPLDSFPPTLIMAQMDRPGLHGCAKHQHHPLAMSTNCASDSASTSIVDL